MSYTDRKITQEEINAHHVQGATDYLIGNAQQNKAVFDALPEFIAGKFNDLIDEIAGQHGDEIKAAVDEWLAEHPEATTTVQDNSLTTAKYVDGSVTPEKLDRTYSTPADLASVNTNLTNELNVLDARMDEFASLPEGSTTADAELLDIRVGANGVTYPSAGDAVRGQVADLKSALFGTKVPTSYESGSININGGVNTDAAYDHCDYVDISDFYKVSFKVSLFSDRGLAFYDANKAVLLVITGLNCTDYGYTETSVPQMVILSVPTSAKYVRFNQRNAYITDINDFVVKGLSVSGLAKEVIDIKEYTSDIKNDNYVQKDGTAQVSVENSEYLDVTWTNKFDGNYVDGKTISGSGSGASSFTYGSNNARYNLVIVRVKPNTKYTVCGRQSSTIDVFRIVTATKPINVGEHFDGAVGVSLDPRSSKFCFTITTGANDKYLYFYGMNYDSSTRPFVQICEGEISDFTTDQYNVCYGTPNDKLRIPATDPGVIIRPVSSTRFDVLIYDQSSKEWLTHTFKKTYTTHTINGNSVVTENVWRADYIKDSDGNNIMQGNTNYIHSLDETGHVGHVGAGHGCAVAVWTLFFADGKQVTPETLDHDVECSCFRMTEKVNHYLIDQSATTSSSDAIPTIENGNPVVESIEYLDAEWTINNRMKIRNRLDIVKNNVKFIDCYAGMMTGYYPYFDHVIVNNPEYIYNALSGTGENITVSNVGGTATVISQLGSMEFDADEVILFGDKYRCVTRIIANDPARYSKLNIESAQFPPNYDNRIKFYFVPCTCSPSAEAEVFNSGARLDVMIIKELDITN